MFGSMIRRLLFRSIFLSIPALVLVSLPGCKAPQSFGDRHSIIVHADPDLWAEVESDVMDALEQRVFTTRPERVFKVTYVAPDDVAWETFRLWQQIVVLGTRDDEIVGDIASRDATPPALVQTTDVWARNQTVTILLLPEAGRADAVRGLLPDLYATLDEQYEDWIIERMYTSGVNDSLASVLASFGFTLQVPNVYLYARDDSVFRFGNPYRQGETDILRSLLITWRTGTDAVTPEELRAWREETGATRYDPSQDVLEEEARFREIEVAGRPGLEFRGVWQDRSDFPAAGPFIARAVTCPEQGRTYYMDGTVYAPGTDKYPYVRQIEVLLDSFRCGGS